MIIVIVIISSIKNIEAMFSLFCASYYNRYEFERKHFVSIVNQFKIFIQLFW